MTWNKDVLKSNQQLIFETDVNLTNNIADNFTIKGFSATAKDSISVPEGGATTLEANNDDIIGTNTGLAKRLRTAANYNLSTKRDLQTEKLVKGDRDTAFSKFGFASVDGSADYKLKLTNTTGEKIFKLGFIDVLPSVNDLAILDGQSRGSKFNPTLKGPLDLGRWAGKVNVYYSTSKNPSRTEFLSSVNYPRNAYRHQNPANADSNVNWLTENQVTDWSTIYSFKIELKPDVVFLEGQNIEINFTLNMPEHVLPNQPAPARVASELLVSEPQDSDSPQEKAAKIAVAKEKAAWNSFAVTTNGLLPTEPERVGIALVSAQSLVIKKVDNQNRDTVLQGAGFELYQDAELRNKIGERKTTSEDGLVRFTGLQDGATYYLVEKAAPEGYLIDTNIYKVIVRSTGIDIEKATADTIASKVIAVDKNQALHKTQATIGNIKKLKAKKLWLPSVADAPANAIVQVELLENGRRVAQQTLSAPTWAADFAYEPKAGATYSVKEVGETDGSITISGSNYLVSVQEDVAEGFIVKNIKKPEEPTVTKKINTDKDSLAIARETDYTYNIKTKLPLDISKYDTYILKDTLDERLQIKPGASPSIVGQAANLFEVVVEGQVVTAKLIDFRGADALKGQEVELIIPAQIKAGQDGPIPNEVTLKYGHIPEVYGDRTPEPGETTPPPVTVTPPPVSPPGGSTLVPPPPNPPGNPPTSPTTPPPAGEAPPTPPVVTPPVDVPVEPIPNLPSKPPAPKVPKNYDKSIPKTGITKGVENELSLGLMGFVLLLVVAYRRKED